MTFAYVYMLKFGVELEKEAMWVPAFSTRPLWVCLWPPKSAIFSHCYLCTHIANLISDTWLGDTI